MNQTVAVQPDRPSRRSKRLDGLLHRAYSQSTKTRFFFIRRIRPAGIGLALVLIVATGISVGHQRKSVYQLFSLTFAMGLISLPWVFLRNAKIHDHRQIPRYGTAGETLSYTIRATNAGKRTVSHAWLSETPPDPRPNLADFRHSREPGEDERNWFDRSLAYYRWQWLINSRRLFEGGHTLEPLSLAPGETKSFSVKITPLRRGVSKLEDLRVVLPDPFGLLQRCRRTNTETSTLTVLPKRYRLPAIEMPGSTQFQVGGDAATNTIGSSGEFVGLRDYRPGDPLRQIHWKSWARTGRPVVKELEDTYFPRYGLILDTFANANADNLFEDAVSVAASFVVTLDKEDSLLDLMFIKDTAHVVTAGRGFARAEKLLEVLAGVTSESETDFEQLSQLVIRHREELTSCLVVLCGWDEARAEFVQSLERGGIICAVIVIGNGERPNGVPGHWLESGFIERDLRRMPSHLRSNL